MSPFAKALLIARCTGCGSAMILNTGKGSTYRYYSWSEAMKQGKIACPGRRIRMDRLDEMVLGHLSEQLFAPDRLTELLKGYMLEARELRERLVALRSQKAELVRDIGRLQDNLQTGELQLSPANMKTLSMEMRKRLVDGPPELRHAYERLLLENVTVDDDCVRLDLRRRGPSNMMGRNMIPSRKQSPANAALKTHVWQEPQPQVLRLAGSDRP